MQLIQALYDEKAELTSDDDFYTRVLRNSDFVYIAPQVYWLLKKQERLGQAPSYFQTFLKNRFIQALIQNTIIQNQQEQLLRQFESCRIDVIPLKGIRFAEKYFGHIGARATSDIDLLIRTADLDRAVAEVKSLGFPIDEEMVPGHFHTSFSKSSSDSPIPLRVELHWDILREDTASFDIEAFWREAHPVGAFRHIRELSNYHTFYMICLHGWRHNLQSLKYFLDIIQMIQLLRDELDFSMLLQDAGADKTLKRIVRTLSIVYMEFPFLDSVMAFPNKRSRLYWEYEAILPLNKKNLKRYVDYIDYQFFSYDSLRHSLTEVFHWMKTDMISAVRSR